jgi:hypothetical protein
MKILIITPTRKEFDLCCRVGMYLDSLPRIPRLAGSPSHFFLPWPKAEPVRFNSVFALAPLGVGSRNSVTFCNQQLAIPGPLRMMLL